MDLDLITCVTEDIERVKYDSDNQNNKSTYIIHFFFIK